MDVDFLIVFVASPLILAAFSLNVSLNVSQLNEGVDGCLEHTQVDHFIVSVLSNLVKDCIAQTILDKVKALIFEQVQCACGEGCRIVVLEMIAILG